MLNYIKGKSRDADPFPNGLEAYIKDDNEVRLIDAFVNSLNLDEFGFKHTAPRRKGRPCYSPSIMLMLYIYGYLNREQSSRRLERAAQINIELMWLIEGMTPDHTTIANFRKDNGEAILAVCEVFTQICISKLPLAAAPFVLDGSKFKAVNSSEKNYTMAKINKQIKGTERHINEYMEKLDATDKVEDAEIRASFEETIEHKKAQLAQLNDIKKRVENSPDKQLSLTDPDSRSMKLGGAGCMVGYNVQIAVDSHYHLIIAHEVTNAPNDSNQLYTIARKAQEAIGQTEITIVADKGYYNGAEFVKCFNDGITPLVPKPEQKGRAKKGLFLRVQFIYDTEKDLYTCPAGKELPYKYTATSHGKDYFVYCERAHCKNCDLRWQCIDIQMENKNSRGCRYRKIMRWEHEDVLEFVQAELAKMPDAMVVRKRTVEHPFGTLKFWMGAVHFLMKGKKKVKTEMSLLVMGYNLKRMINIFGTRVLMEVIKGYFLFSNYLILLFLGALYRVFSRDIMQSTKNALKKRTLTII